MNEVRSAFVPLHRIQVFARNPNDRSEAVRAIFVSNPVTDLKLRGLNNLTVHDTAAKRTHQSVHQLRRVSDRDFHSVAVTSFQVNRLCKESDFPSLVVS